VATPATAKVAVQPAVPSSSDSGTVEARLPIPPSAAVIDVSTV